MSNIKDGITILYEDDNCLVINKPAGIMVHSDGRSKGPFIADWVLKNYPETINVGDPMNDGEGNSLNRAGIVHRLDKETSGVLIIAKNQNSHASLKEQFQNRDILKKYLAFVWGDLKEDFGTISRPIGRSSSDFRKYSAQRGARGDLREAETYWTRIKGNNEAEIITKDGKKEFAKFTFVEVEPKTGRTHQIRVHFNAINHPVVGDSLYAPKRPMVLGFERLALHSRSIEFKTLNNKVVKVEAPLPDDFKKALVLLGIESLSLI